MTTPTRDGERAAPGAGEPAMRVPMRRPGGGGAGPGFGGMPGVVADKSLDFGPSARRLIGRLRPDRFQVLGVIGLAAVSVLLTVLGPLLLGRATDIIFAGAHR